MGPPLTMALTGIGEAWLDDVTVNLLELPVRQASRLTMDSGAMDSGQWTADN